MANKDVYYDGLPVNAAAVAFSVDVITFVRVTVDECSDARTRCRRLYTFNDI